MTRWFSLCALFVAGTVLAQAQMSGFGAAGMDPEKLVQARVDRLAQVLSLTDDQKAQALKIFTDAQTAAERYRQEMQTARQSLLAAVKTNNLAAIDSAARDIGSATAEITSIEARAEAAFYALLTPEQKQKYDQMPGRGRMPGVMGPGMMGASGPARR
ncbi:MAG: Spy/CpxP family protein refolding chaperone [Bryobacteraceae bacterium]